MPRHSRAEVAPAQAGAGIQRGAKLGQYGQKLSRVITRVEDILEVQSSPDCS
jgi:hypothetical protein